MTNFNTSPQITDIQNLSIFFEAYPQGSLGWECYQQAQHSWDASILNWALTVAEATSFVDLYGMAEAQIDAEDLIREPGGHFGELITIWRANWDHKNLPDPNAPYFLVELYWFGLKITTLSTLTMAGIRPEGEWPVTS